MSSKRDRIINSLWALFSFFLVFLFCFFFGFDPFDPISAIFLALLLTGFSEIMWNILYLVYHGVVFVFNEYRKTIK